MFQGYYKPNKRIMYHLKKKLIHINFIKEIYLNKTQNSK